MGKVFEALAPQMYDSLEELFKASQQPIVRKPAKLTELQQLFKYLDNADDNGIPFGTLF